MIAKVAVDTQIPTVDKLYDYKIPPRLESSVMPGVRVIVPFGRGNRHIEAIVLELAQSSTYSKLKQIESVLDIVPVLSDKLLKLAVHMRARLNCAFYLIIKRMLPTGLWYKREDLFILNEDRQMSYEDSDIVKKLIENGGTYKAKEIFNLYPDRYNEINDLIQNNIISKITDFTEQGREKTRIVYTITAEGRIFLQDAPRNKRNRIRLDILNFLSGCDQADYREIAYYTGAARDTVYRLLEAAYIDKCQERVIRAPKSGSYVPRDIILNEEQITAITGLSTLLYTEEVKTAFLYGVTGSGKTEVYIELIKRALGTGRCVIILLPEIALTPQFRARFSYEFGDIVAVLHSGLNTGERFDAWQRICSGEIKIVLGTRSAVFAPIDNIGLIIIDEEHESTFRSDSDPRYHARDVAQFRCYQERALLVLGSATPSIETAYHAKNGDYAYFELPHRAVPVGLPTVIVADKRKAYKAGYHGCIGPELSIMLQNTLANHEQAILFLNRRGSSRSVCCMECGDVPMCINCSTTLSYHKESDRLICHLCGYSTKMITNCQKCGSPYIEQIGAGTQSLEEELQNSFPNARIIRMDSDSTSGKDSHEQLLASFAAGEADILIGTQMIAKGLNFPNVTLSAVIDADMSLYTGDYRSAERTFALITQVVGRSGRAEKPGFAVIQTAAPQNEVIEAAARQDYWDFYDSECELRRLSSQPPFYRYILFTLSSAIEMEAYDSALRFAALLRERVLFDGIIAAVLGPAEAPVHKMNNMFRYIITLRCQDSKQQREMITDVLYTARSDQRNKKVIIDSDINL